MLAANCSTAETQGFANHGVANGQLRAGQAQCAVIHLAGSKRHGAWGDAQVVAQPGDAVVVSLAALAQLNGVTAHIHTSVAAECAGHIGQGVAHRHRGQTTACDGGGQRGVALAIDLGGRRGCQSNGASCHAKVVAGPGDVVVAVGHRALVDGVAAHVFTRFTRHGTAETVTRHQATAGAE